MTANRDIEDVAVSLDEDAGQPGPPRPRWWILIGAMIVLIAGGLVLRLEGAGLPTSEDAIEQQTPGIAVVKSFFQALSDQDAAEAIRMIDPDFAALEIPDPVGYEFRKIFALGDFSWLPSTVEEISQHLEVLAALESNPSVSNCSSEIPRSRRGQELYDRMVTCSVLWNDGLRDRLDDRPILFSIDVGVRDDLIRGFFMALPNQTAQLYGGPVSSFLSWLGEFHPAATMDLFDDWEWGWGWGWGTRLRSPSAAVELLILADEYHTWTDEFERTGVPSAPVSPGWIGHVMLNQPSAEGILLVGSEPRLGSDLWAFDALTGVWEPYGPTGSAPEYPLLAVANPSSNWVLGIADSSWSTEETAPWIWSPKTLAWEELPPPPSEDSAWGLIRQRVLPDSESDGFLVVLHDGVWRFDPRDGDWSSAPELDPLADKLSVRIWTDERFATIPFGDVLIHAGAGKVQSIDVATARMTTLTADGPVEASAMVHDPSTGLMVIIGDGALWTFDLETEEVERVVDVTAPENTTRMYWRTAAAAYDEAADLVIICDGEQTWSYDVEKRNLRFLSS